MHERVRIRGPRGGGEYPYGYGCGDQPTAHHGQGYYPPYEQQRYDQRPDDQQPYDQYGQARDLVGTPVPAAAALHRADLQP